MFLKTCFEANINPSEWANAAPIRSAVKESLMEASKASKLSKLEMPSNFHIETLQWLPETGLVTDAFKIKRKVSK